MWKMAGKNIQGKVSSVIRGISGPVLGHYAKLKVVDIFSIFNQWLAMYVTRFSSVLYKYLTLQNQWSWLLPKYKHLLILDKKILVLNATRIFRFDCLLGPFMIIWIII